MDPSVVMVPLDKIVSLILCFKFWFLYGIEIFLQIAR